MRSLVDGDRPTGSPGRRFPYRIVAIRSASGAVLAVVGGLALYLGYPYVHAAVLIAVLLMASEWLKVCGGLSGPSAVALPWAIAVSVLFAGGIGAAVLFAAGGAWAVAGILLAASAVAAAAVRAPAGNEGGRSAGWIAVGAFYIAVPALAFLWLYDGGGHGPAIVGWIVLVVVATDIGAYVVGRTVGGPRLAPQISPAKTWSGLVGGGACAGAAGATYGAMFGLDLAPVAIASFVLGVVSQIGDLIESQIKRHFRVKDFGGVIPGHGGVLDRVDGLMLAVATVALVVAVFGSGIL